MDLSTAGVILGTVVAVLCDVITRTFVNDDTLDSCRPGSGYLVQEEAVSMLDCARRCNNLSNCLSFFYTHEDRQCQLHDVHLDGQTDTAGWITNSTSSKYYIVHTQGDLAVSTVPTDMVTTMTPGVDCSLLTTDWTMVNIPNISSSYIKVFTDMTRNQQDAVTLCAAHNNSSLLKITNVKKLTYFQSHVFNCAGLVDKTLWLDGTNVDPTDGISTLGTWITSEGESISMEQGSVWVPGRPNDPSNHHCLRAWFMYGHRLDDMPCDNIVSVYSICEKIN